MKQSMKIQNIPAALKENSVNTVEYYGDKTYFKKTYSEIYVDLMKALAFLNRQEISRGNRIGIIGGNSYEYMLVDLACIVGGYVSVPFPEKDFKNRIDKLEPEFDLKLLFADSKYLENGSTETTFNLNTFLGAIENEKSENVRLVPVNREDVFTILFTSGTTGTPKGIEMRAKCVQEWIDSLLGKFEFYRDDKVIDFLPLSISNARLFVYGAILIQFDLILTTPEQLVKVLYASKPTILQGVPYLFETIYENMQRNIKASVLKHGCFNAYVALKKILPRSITGKIQQKLFGQALQFWGGRMRIMVTGSAPIRKNVLKFYEDIGLRIYEAYGINEIGLISINSPGAYRMGSVGKPFGTKEVKISDDGEILIRSEYSWGRGYINDNEGYSEGVFRKDGFVSTGDAGYFDKDGFLFIEGRIKEVLVLTNGEKIHPNLIEGELKNSSSIKQAIAIGNQKPFIVCILVLDETGTEKAKIQEIIDGVNAGLPESLHIKGFIVAQEPFTIENGLMNSTLKVNRNKVYEAYKNEIEALYQ